MQEEEHQAKKAGKTPGIEEITQEQRTFILRILDMWWKKSETSPEQTSGVISPIYKKGNTRDCGKFRGIVKLMTFLNLYKKIL